MRSTGHRFSGVERKTLLELLAGRAQSLGAEVYWQQEIRDLSDCNLPAADLIAHFRELGAELRGAGGIELRSKKESWNGTVRLGESTRDGLSDLRECNVLEISLSGQPFGGS